MWKKLNQCYTNQFPWTGMWDEDETWEKDHKMWEEDYRTEEEDYKMGGGICSLYSTSSHEIRIKWFTPIYCNCWNEITFQGNNLGEKIYLLILCYNYWLHFDCILCLTDYLTNYTLLHFWLYTMSDWLSDHTLWATLYYSLYFTILLIVNCVGGKSLYLHMLHRLYNQISSSAHSSVVRRHVEVLEAPQGDLATTRSWLSSSQTGFPREETRLLCRWCVELAKGQVGVFYEFI